MRYSIRVVRSIERLESRMTPSWVVTKTSDYNPLTTNPQDPTLALGTLRSAIELAMAFSTDNTVTFNTDPNVGTNFKLPQTINLHYGSIGTQYIPATATEESKEISKPFTVIAPRAEFNDPTLPHVTITLGSTGSGNEDAANSVRLASCYRVSCMIITAKVATTGRNQQRLARDLRLKKAWKRSRRARRRFASAMCAG